MLTQVTRIPYRKITAISLLYLVLRITICWYTQKHVLMPRSKCQHLPWVNDKTVSKETDAEAKECWASSREVENSHQCFPHFWSGCFFLSDFPRKFFTKLTRLVPSLLKTTTTKIETQYKPSLAFSFASDFFLYCVLDSISKRFDGVLSAPICQKNTHL